MLSLLQYVDGGWFDIVTFLVAITPSVTKCIRRKHRFVSQQTGRDIIHGIALFPLLMLSVSVFSKEILGLVAQSNRLILTVTGAAALFSILEDEFAEDREARL